MSYFIKTLFPIIALLTIWHLPVISGVDLKAWHLLALCCHDRGAWNKLVWFSALVMMVSFPNESYGQKFKLRVTFKSQVLQVVDHILRDLPTATRSHIIAQGQRLVGHSNATCNAHAS